MSDIVPPCDCAEVVDNQWVSRCEYLHELAGRAAAEIDRLRAEVETVGAMHREACELAKHRMQELATLRATNERLWAALVEIADLQVICASDMARAALAEEKKG